MKLRGAFSNATRRKILQMLVERSMYQSEIVRKLGLREQAVVRHLKMLEELGLITSWTQYNPNGPARRYYSISEELGFLKELDSGKLDNELLSIFLRDCLTGPQALRQELERLRALEIYIEKLLERLGD
ncbi:MAG: ArsR/SmtB family transcription factor [Thermoprotei archaeon]